MSVGLVFKDCIEPCVERIPVLEVTHEEKQHGRAFMIIQKIQRNVFTDFDRKLSRHLAATRGLGFPPFTVSIGVAERNDSASLRPLGEAHYASVPHALKGIAERALGQSDRADLLILHNDSTAGDQGAGLSRTVTRDDIDVLDAGLRICRYLGESEFLNISGDFDIVLAGPPGDLKPLMIHLNNGSISMQCASGDSITPFESPLHGFASHLRKSVLAQGYMAQARHALVAEKENAVVEFRSAAEHQILNFDRALAGRPLDGHRLQSAVALVERLKAGLGSSIKGLSEDARITALDWSVLIETDGNAVAIREPVNVVRAACG